MNNLDVSKTYEEAKTLNQECGSTTQGLVTLNPQMLRIMEQAARFVRRFLPKGVPD